MEPIKIGDSFGNYNDLFKTLNHNGNVTYDAGYLGQKGRYHRFSGQNVNGTLMAGNAKIEVYNDGFEGNCGTIYTNKYRPQNAQVKGNNNEPFTTIYNYRDDIDKKNQYYYKATDLNGNGYIDEGEITQYSSLKELLNNGF